MSLTPHEIRQALDEPTVRGMQVMQLALVLGVVLFAAFTVGRAVFFPQLRSGEVAVPDGSFLRSLTIANFAVLIATFLVGQFLFRSRLAAGATDAVALVASLRAATLVRLALLEGAALFGVAICFLATPSGPPADPAAWLNLVSPAAFVLFALATFPGRDRLTAVLTDRSL